MILSLENKSIAHGAEYCNTLAQVVESVINFGLEEIAIVGVGIPIICLIHESRDNVHMGEQLTNYVLDGLITSIQLSFDFLTRDAPHRDNDNRPLHGFAHAPRLPLSLEEFGLLGNQIQSLAKHWRHELEFKSKCSLV